MKGKNFFIVIAGNIACGKTTLAKQISKKLNIRMYEEPVRDNPFLDNFYKYLELIKKNPNNKKIRRESQKSAYLLQEFYFLNRVLDHKKILSYNETIIQDRSIYEDREIFTKHNFEKRNISVKDYIKYNILYFLLARKLRKPHLIIYLSTSVDVLKKRLKKRNNPYEKELIEPNNTYLEDLNKKYKVFIKNYNKGPKLIINSDDLDFSKDGEDLKYIVNKINTIIRLEKNGKKS